MTAALAPGRVRVELWDDYPAAGGVRRAFVSGAQAVLRVLTPDTLDFSGQAELALIPTTALVSALETYETPIWRLVPLNADGTASATDPIAYFRGRTYELALGAGQATLTASAVHPLLDWDTAGRCRTVTTGGLTSFTLSGDYTPTQALALAFTRLTAIGRTYWASGTIDRTDVKHVDVVALTPLALARAVAQLWEGELEYAVNGAETQLLVGLRTRVGQNAAVPTLRMDDSGALLALTKRLDATDLAHEVEPLGAAGVTMARAAWSVEAVNAGTGWIDVKDPSGGQFGPVQLDGQFVGNYLRDTSNARHQILASLRTDGTTSQFQVASTTGFAVATPRQHVEIAADSSGTLLTSVADPAVAASARVRVTLERTDLTADRNYVPNPRGATGSPPTGWTITGAGAFSRGTPPAGCPIGDDGTGQMWEVTGLIGTLKLPATNVLDVPNGDAQVVCSAWVYLVAAGTTSDLAFTASPFGGPTLLQANAGAWVRLDLTGTLGTAQAMQLRFDPATVGQQCNFWIAAGQLQRAAGGSPAWTEYERPRPNLLHQAANGHLLGHHTAPRTLPRATYDEQALAASGVGLTLGGDVRVVVAAYGIDTTARYVGRQRSRHAPAPADLSLVQAPDPTIAALTGSASPGRQLLLSEVLAQSSG